MNAPQHAKPKNFKTLMVIISAFFICAYTIAFFICKWNFPNMTWDATLTTAWFAFWGTEILAVAGIQITNTIKGK